MTYVETSALALPGSPVEQGSLASLAYYWDPRPELSAGAVPTSVTCAVYCFPLSAANGPPHPATAGLVDVSGSVLVAPSPFLGAGAYAGMVGVVLAHLTAGHAYRVVLSCTGSDGNAPERFFTILCSA